MRFIKHTAFQTGTMHFQLMSVNAVESEAFDWMHAKFEEAEILRSVYWVDDPKFINKAETSSWLEPIIIVAVRHVLAYHPDWEMSIAPKTIVLKNEKSKVIDILSWSERSRFECLRACLLRATLEMSLTTPQMMPEG